METKRPAGFSIWVLALAGAALLHAACAVLAMDYLRPEEADDDLGAAAIEVGVELMSPRMEPSDLPPGPESEEAMASPAVAAREAVVEEVDLPKAMPDETEDPERVVTLESRKKPVEEEPKISAPATPSAESIAAEATAPPFSEAIREGPRSVAPVLGTGASTQRMRVTWQKELASHLDKFKRYPQDREHKTAEIVVGFEIDRTGHVLSSHIVRGSGDAAFDEAALAMMRRANPVPAPPPLLADEGLSFSLPVIFRVKGKT